MPSSWISLVIFLVFLAPGVHYRRLSRRRRTPAAESVLAETGDAIVSSVLLGMPSTLIVTVSSQLVTGKAPDLGLVASGLSTSSTDGWIGLLACIIGYLVVAVAIAYFFDWFMGRTSRATIVTHDSMWWGTFVDSPEGFKKVVATVEMKNGSVWSGEVLDFSPDHTVADRELVLCSPISYKPALGDSFDEVDLDRVVLRGVEIGSLGIKYGAAEDRAEPDNDQTMDSTMFLNTTTENLGGSR